MKIGLIRHFKVDYEILKRCNSREYIEEYVKYEQSGIMQPHSIPGVKGYSACYSSTSRRALETARLVYKNQIISTPALVEIPLYPLFNTRKRLPVKMWHFINRIAWFYNSSKMPETRIETKKRAGKFLDTLLDSHAPTGNILPVSHGFFIITLHIELLKRGFKGWSGSVFSASPVRYLFRTL